MDQLNQNLMSGTHGINFFLYFRGGFLCTSKTYLFCSRSVKFNTQEVCLLNKAEERIRDNRRKLHRTEDRDTKKWKI